MIIWKMKLYGIYKREEEDDIVWQGRDGKINVLVKDIYLSIIEEQFSYADNIYPFTFWKYGCPYKSILLSWLVYHNKNLTWENLQKRNWHSPAICSISLSESEENLHIFLQCIHTQVIWKKLASHFGFYYNTHSSIKDAFVWWSKQKVIWRPIPLIFYWFIWNWRNRVIFQDYKENFIHIFDHIISLYLTLLPNIP